MEPLVSVVVPVYNVEKYLRQCVDSILGQTYTKLEVILVDDGSTDSSGRICDEYAAADARVRVINKTNSGSADSRKVGLDVCRGDYIMFIDADDWIDSQTVSSCVTRAIQDQSDCVLFPYVREYSDNSLPVHFFPEDKLFAGAEAKEKIYRRLFGLRNEELAEPAKADSLVSCCMKLYSVDCARKGRFFDTKEVGSCEDALFNIHALQGVDRISYINEPFYHYRRTNSASLTSTYRPKLAEQWQKLYSYMRDAIIEYGLGEEYTEALNNRIAFSIIGWGFVELADPQKNRRIQNIRKYLMGKQYSDCVIKLPIAPMSLIWKVFFLMCKMRFAVGVYGCLKMASKLKGKM